MSRKDYIELAAILKRFRDGMPTDDLRFAVDRDLIVDIAAMLYRDNPNFQHAKFIRACGIGE